ncbi:MAG: ATP-binding protein, partial [Bacteroidota bacterium]|nr:ATP-binding protein [Bacteroidota bacterium]
IRTKGVRIPGTNFYLLERMNGRICYFGRFFFKDIPPRGRTLYVELNSRILSEGIGFPELLLDEKVTRSKNLERFSSAKFYDGKLVDRRGKFQYILSPKVYLDKAGVSNFFEMNNYEHYLYRLKGSNIIVVSRPKVQAIDYLVSFPYIFVFFFLFSLGLSFFNVRRRKSPPGLKQKIQIALVSTMLVSLVFVAIGTIFYNVRDYRVRRQDDLGDKLQSVLSVLETQVTGLDSINGSYLQMLRETELFRLSEIFSTDINLYDLDGNLLASSRPEIFRKGLLSRKMSAEAYSELAYKDQMRYIQPEKIGGLEYMSAYIPLLNDREQPLAYINLPYFVKEDKMKQEVSTFVVAFINIYVFMILASILIAVVISNQVTRPLVLVRDKLRTIQLGKKNEPISYEGNDEIGSIVKEYNRKVEELAVSADRLAQSERESAWREMARQIAHEIKNPLTPMKLNIQYLQRAKKEQLPDYDAYFNRVTKTLIEQIDTLSSIASSFSNFAKTPKPHMESVSLEERVNEVLGLFENTASVEFLFLNRAQSDDHVYVDREQITRVLINLVKNAIQAIPKNRKGKVEVTIKRNDDRVILEVMDNGPGVPEELREKLFRPNFTTKSSGMGLGLAISKSIIENFNGKIGFITSQNQGTTFFIDLPSFDSFRDENKISHA